MMVNMCKIEFCFGTNLFILFKQHGHQAPNLNLNFNPCSCKKLFSVVAVASLTKLELIAILARMVDHLYI